MLSLRFSRLILCATALLFVPSSSKALVLNGDPSKNYTFALVVKTIQNPFFLTVLEGWEHVMKQFDNVDYVFLGPEAEENPDSVATQARILDHVIEQGGIDGIAVSAIHPSIAGQIKKAIDFGIPTITVDSDVAKSKRMTFVGPDNNAIGFHTGKVLMQLKPEGGTFCLATFDGPNLQERVEGARQSLNGSNWIEADTSPVKGTLDEVSHTSRDHPDIGAFLALGGWLTDEANEWVSFIEHENITTVHVDASDTQVLLMKQGHVDGVIGQLPFEMGQVSAQTLIDITIGKLPEKELLDTHLLELVLVPHVLPKLDINENCIGRLVIMGYILFTLVAIMTLGSCAWTVRYRQSRVVKASQPIFLLMICTGVWTMGFAIIPATFDDERNSERACDVACMCVPWFTSIGVNTILSALFCKTWRINRLHRHAIHFRRVKVAEQHVLVPYVILMACNVVILVCWTLLAPLRYVRIAEAGTDGWNRVIASYGTCKTHGSATGGSIPYIVCLAITNLAALVIAEVQAYKARQINTEFAESRYIAIIVACMLQALVLGVPILVLVWDQPTAKFVVLTLLDFLICSTIILFMFVPKVLLQYQIKKGKEPCESRRESSIVFGSQRNQSTPTVTAHQAVGRIRRDNSSTGMLDGNSRRSSLRFDKEPWLPSELADNASESLVGTVLSMLEGMPVEDRRIVFDNLENGVARDRTLRGTDTVATEVKSNQAASDSQIVEMLTSEESDRGDSAC